jgi:hypothetical protein
MQPTTYAQVSTDEALQGQPNVDLRLHVHGEVPTPISPERSFFSMHGILMSCIIPPIMGFGFVSLGLYITYSNSTLVVSKSTHNAAVISQAVTTLFAIWHLVALIPAFSVVQRVRREEWWRRMLRGTYFNRANSVSSNINGTFGHTYEMAVSWSSRYFKLAWVTTITAAIIADIAPGAIRVEVGLSGAPSSYPVPALPPNSIYSNYSQPFLNSGDILHASADIAPIYYEAFTFVGLYFKTTPPAYNVLVPRPNITPGQGYRYSTDV